MGIKLQKKKNYVRNYVMLFFFLQEDPENYTYYEDSLYKMHS